MQCCQTCCHWDRDGRTAALVGGFRYCLRDWNRGVPAPKAPDAGQWCEWHSPRPAEGETIASDSPRNAA